MREMQFSAGKEESFYVEVHIALNIEQPVHT